MNIMKKGMKLLSLLLLSIFLISFISAEVYTQGQTIDLKISCSNLNCNSPINITITYPNSSIAINNQLMNTNNGYSDFLFSNTQILGQYQYYATNGTSSYSNYFTITPTGTIFGLPEVFVYIFTLLVVLLITYGSINLINENSIKKDTLDDSKMYEMKKVHEFSYYLELLKRKMWIVGLYGIYLSILLFLALLGQLTLSMGLSDLGNIMGIFTTILLWGLPILIVFTFAYIIVYFYKATENIMRYQFGGLKAK